MLFYGLDSISLYRKRDYRRRLRGDIGLDMYRRWQTLGERLRHSMDKVVKQNVE